MHLISEKSSNSKDDIKSLSLLTQGVSLSLPDWTHHRTVLAAESGRSYSFVVLSVKSSENTRVGVKLFANVAANSCIFKHQAQSNDSIKLEPLLFL